MNVNWNNLRIANCISTLFSQVIRFTCFSLIILSLNLSISADEKKNFTYYIEWQNVAGAKGYLIQIKDKSNGTEKEEKLNQNNAELKLPAGLYEFRIASINKFGKPSTWTSWEEFLVEKDKPRPNPKDAKQAEVKVSEEKPTKPTQIKKWKWFVPGLVQYQSNQKLYSGLWVFWFTALALYVNSERVAGNNLASNNLHDPIFLSALSLGTPVSLDLYLWTKRKQAESEYNHHQSNQQAVGAVAILSYALQVWHAKRVADKSNVSVELNSRSQRFTEVRSAQADNPFLSFELKISMRY
jgi:hypothetical protein